MRILIATWSSRRAGGTETYLAAVTSALARRGHSLGFCHEVEEPADRPVIELPEGTAMFRVGNRTSGAWSDIRAWRPDVTYAHGLLSPAVETRVLGFAPAVLAGHSYYGTCISGDKAHRFPIVQPCARVFGPACLALYFPRRCGGRSPVSMVHAYRRQRRRQRLLSRYAAVITPSEHMRREFVRHGTAPDRTHTLSFAQVEPAATTAAIRPRRLVAGAPLRLTFIGRMTELKGGQALLAAAGPVHAQLRRRVEVTLAGDGPSRDEWERQAQRITRTCPGVAVTFAGWLSPQAVAAHLDQTDIVVVPSLWPEPFGLVGPEANRRGIPVVAYGTGGIPEWLEDGVNGCLAPGDPPAPDGLAAAIVRCATSLTETDQLSSGALSASGKRPARTHVDALLQILERAAASAAAGRSA